MNQKNDFIAVFDSGVGGISVLRHLLTELPNERFLYFGDSINAPYGVRPREEVEQLTMAALEKLMERGLKAFVIACNTATAAAVEALRAKYPDFIIVGIEPAVKLAVDRHPGGHIGVMATPGTLKSPRVLSLIDRVRGDCTIEMLPAPGLADLVEANKQNGPEGEALLRPWLEPLVGKIPGLRHLEVRPAFQGMDYALYSEFESRQALADYADHPLHLEAKDKFHHMIATRVAADYDL